METASKNRQPLAVLFLFTFAIMVAPAPAMAGSPIVEIRTADATLTGKVVAFNDAVCWIAEPDGHYHDVRTTKVLGFQRLPGDFRPLSREQMRVKLRSTFPDSYTVASSGNYLVVGHRSAAAAYAQLLARIDRQIGTYFSKRRIPLADPEFPLVAIVFGSHQEFVDHSAELGITNIGDLSGYYLRTSNRVLLFDEPVPPEQVSRVTSSPKAPFGNDGRRGAFAALARSVYANPGRLQPTIQADVRDTLVHEATHQVGFNRALHQRIGENPRWLVEGLAMLFESEAILASHGSQDLSQRINRGRLEWFRRYRNDRRTPRSLSQLITSDDLFGQALLDAYAESWALTFFLVETRAADYSRYLQLLRKRDPLAPYSPEARLSDFQSAFGKDVDWLEVQFLRFMDQLASIQ